MSPLVSQVYSRWLATRLVTVTATDWLRAVCGLQGGDCFGAFMQWGLPKGTLKDVWGIVAGDEGFLNQHQFVQCLYLMDNAKRVCPSIATMYLSDVHGHHVHGLHNAPCLACPAHHTKR